MKKRSVKIVFGVVIVCFAAACGALVWLLTGGSDTIQENRKVVSVWYSNTPVENTLTFYDDGTYTSEAFGSPEGIYTIESDSQWILDDQAGGVWTATVDGDYLSFQNDHILHEYYSSPDLIPKKSSEDKNIDYGLLSLRLTQAQKLLDQGEWTGDGHTLEATMTTITIDGKESCYTVEDADASDPSMIKYSLLIDGNPIEMDMSMDQETLVYTITLDGMVFTTPGENLRLDS